MKQQKLFRDPIKSIAFSQSDILEDIIHLHLNNEPFELDPTYGQGGFYQTGVIIKPKFKYDLHPRTDESLHADCRRLSFRNNSIKSILFDPPFLAGFSTEFPRSGNIMNKYKGFRNIDEMFSFYSESMEEFYRILKNNGFLIFKCQDTISGKRQYFSHVFIINEAERIGYYIKDLFILLSKTRIIGHNHKKQHHARKYHSYFIVMQKKGKVNK